MEKVRLSLQSMLKSSEHFLQDDKVSPKSVRTTPGLCSLTSFFQLYTCRDKDSGYDFKTNTALSTYGILLILHRHVTLDEETISFQESNARKSFVPEHLQKSFFPKFIKFYRFEIIVEIIL